MTSERGGSVPKKRSRWEDLDEETSLQTAVVIKKPKASKKPTRAPKAISTDSEGDAATSASLTPLRNPRPVSPSEPRLSQFSRAVPPRTFHPSILPCRSVYCYKRLNHIEEGSYGVVFRAQEIETGDIVALKKLKLDEEKQGFPITSLREIMALMNCHHENVVGIREIVVGDTLTQYAHHLPSNFRHTNSF